MRKGIGVVGAAALLSLAACGGDSANVTTNVETGDNVTTNDIGADIPPTNATIDSAAAPTVQLAADGLALASSAGSRHLAFNGAHDATVQAVTAVLGEPADQGTNPECGAGPLDSVDYKGGLALFFQDGKFVGWDLDGRDGSSLKTAGGIGIGSTLQQLRDAGDVAVQDTSLGIEFTAGEMSGLLTANRPEGKITSLWAGTICAFR